MGAFDPNEYRKTVMARLHADFSPADPETGDIFFVCALDPGADTPTALKRLDDVVAAWQRDRNHPKYKGITAELVKRRPATAAPPPAPASRVTVPPRTPPPSPSSTSTRPHW